MATREIKTRFKLEGENEYKKAMTDAANAVKVLNSEEKLAKAQFEATGDAQQYAADQARILKEQIDHQKKSVAAAEEALKKLTENGVDKNSRQVTSWKLKLNNAKTALYNMQSRLDKVGTELGEEKTAFGDAETAGHNFGEEMGKVANGISLQNAITAVDSIKSHIEEIVRAAARAAKAMWDFGVEGSKWADDLSTAANFAGIDVETYQSWQYASRFIDTSVDDIVNNFKDIDNKFVAGGDTAREYMALLAEIGIASGKTDGSMRSSQEIFYDLIDYLHGIGDDTERTRQAINLFGNDWRKLNPLITAGSAAYKEMAEQGRSVAVVSEKIVEALGSMNDSYEDMTARLKTFQMNVLAALAPTFNQVADALSKAITAMDDFVKSEEGQAALGSLNDALSGLINAFLGDDNGKGTFESIVTAAKNAVGDLTTALNWISEHGETVAGAITVLGAAWAGLTVSKEVLTFVMLLKALPLSKFSALMSGGKSLTGGAAPGGGGSVAGPVPTGKPVGSGFIANLKHAAGVASPYLSVAAITAGFGALMDKWSTEKNFGKYNSIIEQFQAATTLASEKAEALRQNVLKLRDAWGQGNGEGVTAGHEFFRANAADIYQQMPDLSIWKRWEEVFGSVDISQFTPENLEKFVGFQDEETGIWWGPTLAEHWETFIKEYTEHADTLVNEAEESGEETGAAIADSLAEAITEETSTVEDATEGMLEAAAEAGQDQVDFRSKGTAFEVLGEMIDEGLAQGIYNNADAALEAIYWLSRRVAAGSRAILQVHSPSKVFEEIGLFVGQGFADGIEESAAGVDKAMRNMLSITAAPTARRSGAYGTERGAAAGAADTVHVTLVLDDEVLGDVMAPIINDKIGARINATRRS